MYLWSKWFGITELSYKVSVSGDGKTNLDGMFGRFMALLLQACKAGASYWSATSILNTYDMSSGISGVLLFIFTPLWDNEPSTDEDRLRQYTILELDAGEGVIVGRHHSGMGSGMKISLESIVDKWHIGDPSPPECLSVATENQESTIGSSTLHTVAPFLSKKEVSKLEKINQPPKTEELIGTE